VGKPVGESPLMRAVQALDAELHSFEQLAHTAERVPLTSERNLEKAAKAINDAAESQKRVGAHIATLIDAISKARQQHDATADKIIARRDELEARAELFNAQLARFAALGKEATDISAVVRTLGEHKVQPPSQETVQQLSDVAGRLERVAGAATELGKEADAAQMEELARNCDSLKQQVQSALNKVTLLRDKLAASL
jgi:hypothetical protein